MTNKQFNEEVKGNIKHLNAFILIKFYLIVLALISYMVISLTVIQKYNLLKTNSIYLFIIVLCSIMSLLTFIWLTGMSDRASTILKYTDKQFVCVSKDKNLYLITTKKAVTSPKKLIKLLKGYDVFKNEYDLDFENMSEYIKTDADYITLYEEIKAYGDELVNCKYISDIIDSYSKLKEKERLVHETEKTNKDRIKSMKW